MARFRTFFLLLCLVLYVLHSDAGRFSSRGFSKSFSRSSSRGSRGGWFSSWGGRRTDTTHVKPSVHKTVQQSSVHQNVHNAGTQRPIGFVNPYNPSQSIGSAHQDPFKPSAPMEVHNSGQKVPVQQTGHVGTQRPIGFVDPNHQAASSNSYMPSAPKEVHNSVQKVPVQQMGNSGTQRPIGFVDPNHQVGSSNSYMPSAPNEVHSSVQKVPVQQMGSLGPQRPIGFVDPHNSNHQTGGGTFNPYKPSAPVHETINKGQTSVNNNAYGMGQSYPTGYASPSHGYQTNYGGGGYYGNTYHQGGYGHGYGYNHPNDYSSWYRQPYSTGGTTHINYGPVNYANGYPSYGSSYHYTPVDTGSGTLGFFLGYGLGRLTSPSYYYNHYHPSESVYHYDHYTVHHYYHNKEAVPQQLTVSPNTVVACAGNSSLLCPPNTAALCMSNGTIMCVAKPETLIRCPNNTGAYCVQSPIPEINSTTPTTDQNNSTIINIPCISNATLYGNLTYQNNSIILKDDRNSTVSGNTTNLLPNNSTSQVESGHPVVFCITVIAEPAMKKPDAAVLYEKLRGNTLHFLARAFGAS